MVNLKLEQSLKKKTYKNKDWEEDESFETFKPILLNKHYITRLIIYN